MPAGKLVVRTAVAALLALSLWHAGWSAWRAQAFGVVDYPIFLRNAQQFLHSGLLYPERDDLSAYAPAAAVYKFPPLYALFLLPVVRDGIGRGDLFGQFLLQLALYAAAIAVLLLLTRRAAVGAGARTALVLILALNYEPFYETLWRLQLETPILLLLLLALLALGRGHDPWSGAALGVAVMLKIYPAVLLVWLALRRRYLALAGCAAAMLAVAATTIIVFGWRENAFYATTLLPHLLRETPVVTTENVALGRYLQTLLHLSPELAKRLTQVFALPALAWTAWLLLRSGARRREGTGMLVELAPFLALMLLAMPNAWVNYQLLLLPAFVGLALALVERHPLPRLPLTALALAWVPTLFYAPCAGPETGWPCSETPRWLGLVQLPRALHDAGVALRGLTPLLLWAVALWLLAAAGASAAGHPAQAEGGDAPG